MSVEAGVGDRQGGGHAGHAPADDEGGAHRGAFLARHRMGASDSFDRPCHQLARLAGGADGVVGMDPGALFPQVDQLEAIGVDPSVGGQALKEGLMRPMAARAHDQAADSGRGSPLPQALPSLRQAGEGDGLARGYAGLIPHVPGDGGKVDDVVDLAGATAQRHGDTFAIMLGRDDRRRAGDEGLAAGKRPPAEVLVHQQHRFGRRAGSVQDRLGDFLGRGEGAADEDARAGGGQRRELVRLAEAVVVQANPEKMGDFEGVLGRADADRQDHQVEAILLHRSLPGRLFVAAAGRVAQR